MRVLPILLLLLSVQAAGPAKPVQAAELCIDDWSVAAPVVKEERLAGVETVMKRAKAKVDGEVLKVTLCQKDGVWVYRLLVRSPAGRHAAVIVNATDPFGH